MSQFMISEYLILILLLPVVLRFIVLKSTGKDIFSVFAPVALIVSILQIAAFGLNISTLLLFLLTVLVFFTNIRSLSRFCNGLFIDWFSFGYRLFSILEFLLIIFLGVCIVLFRPTATPEPYVVQTFHYTGNTIHGYTEKSTFFEKTTLTVYRFSPDEPTQVQENLSITLPKPTLVYLQDPRTTVKDNIFNLASLASRGYTIYAADTQNSYFSTSRHFLLRLASYFIPDFYSQRTSEFINSQSESLSFLLEQATVDSTNTTPDGYSIPKLFIVADGLASSIAQKNLEQFPDKLGGCYIINFTDNDENGIPHFSSTPAYFDGYGNIPLFYPEEVILFAGKRNKAASGVPSLIAAEVEAASFVVHGL